MLEVVSTAGSSCYPNYPVIPGQNGWWYKVRTENKPTSKEASGTLSKANISEDRPAWTVAIACASHVIGMHG